MRNFAAKSARASAFAAEERWIIGMALRAPKLGTSLTLLDLRREFPDWPRRPEEVDEPELDDSEEAP